MGKRSSLLVVTTLVGVHFGLHVASASQPKSVVLQYKFKKGEILRYQVSGSEYQPGMPTEVDPNLFFRGVLRMQAVERQKSGEWAVRLSYESLRIHVAH